MLYHRLLFTNFHRFISRWKRLCTKSVWTKGYFKMKPTRHHLSLQWIFEFEFLLFILNPFLAAHPNLYTWFNPNHLRYVFPVGATTFGSRSATNNREHRKCIICANIYNRRIANSVVSLSWHLRCTSIYLPVGLEFSTYIGYLIAIRLLKLLIVQHDCKLDMINIVRNLPGSV